MYCLVRYVDRHVFAYSRTLFSYKSKTTVFEFTSAHVPFKMYCLVKYVHNFNGTYALMNSKWDFFDL